MEINVCKVCGTHLKLIPAGISKTTQKPYSAFYSCPNRCKQWGTSNPAPKPQAGAITTPQVDIIAKLDAIKADLQTIKDSQVSLMQFISKELGD